MSVHKSYNHNCGREQCVVFNNSSIVTKSSITLGEGTLFKVRLLALGISQLWLHLYLCCTTLCVINTVVFTHLMEIKSFKFLIFLFSVHPTSWHYNVSSVCVIITGPVSILISSDHKGNRKLKTQRSGIECHNRPVSQIRAPSGGLSWASRKLWQDYSNCYMFWT